MADTVLTDADGVVRFRGTSQPFTPTDLDDLALWLDASDAATINEGSPSDGDPVSAWADKSTNGYDAAQVDADAQPAWQDAAQGGRAVLAFDSSVTLRSLGLSGAGLDLLRDIADFTVAVVGSQASGESLNALAASAAAGGASPRCAIGFYAFNGLDIAVDLTETGSGNTLTSTDWNYGQGGFYGQLAVVLGTRGANGSVGGNVTCPGGQGDSNLPAAGATPDTASQSVVIGGDVVGSTANGQLGEILVYRRALTMSERRQVLEYLSAKWATV